MASFKKYSVEEVLNFTVKDIPEPDFVEVKVKGWFNLTSERREACIMKLRDLVRQRDQMAQSNAVDANGLEKKLRLVRSSPSQTPTPPPPDPNDPKDIEKDMKVEIEAYKALVDDHGRPCYPIELGFDVLDDSGQYQDIISYWQKEEGMTRFPEYQQKVRDRRCRHGLDGDVELLEDRDKQSKLVNWMEYQDYEYQGYESFEKDIEGAQAQLESRQKALTEAELPGFEGVYEPGNFGTRYAMAIEHHREDQKAWDKRLLAERELELAEKRLKAAQSDELGETVKRSPWIRLFLEDAQSARMQQDKILKSNCCREDWHVEGKRQRPASEDVEECNQWWDVEDRFREASKKWHDAEIKAEQEVELAEEGLKAARSDDFEETVERAALIRMVQEEVQSAQTRFEQAIESTEKVKLKGKVLSALNWVPCAKSKSERHMILLEWTERQRREIASGCADTEKEGSQAQVTRARLSTLRNHTATEASRPNGSLMGIGRERKQRVTRSIPSTIDPSKVSKAPRKKLIPPRRKMSILNDASQPAEKATLDPSIPELRSKRASKVKDIMPTSLRPIHSSRVSKSVGKRSTELRGNDVKQTPTTDGRQSKREIRQSMSSAPSAGRKPMQQSVSRSSRMSKKPERFVAG
ncbi:MAG: hypothetical protein FRX48_04836 [Lasallia pustulata]|uniref:Uncharacterized protein n=1 Tax=Lasallia pustulata TaxID=136370 RepID=A0A5M8PPQ8_9LECA|nr:MAG: hypothetical protein FRX48_04836 [Lasallia pustulata]